jgi:hypothetical protein
VKGMFWLVGVFLSLFFDTFLDLLDSFLSFFLSLFLFLDFPFLFSFLFLFLFSLFFLFNFLLTFSKFTFEPYECVFGFRDLDLLYPVLAHITHLLGVLLIDFLELIVLTLIKRLKLVVFGLDIQEAKQKHQQLPSRHPHSEDIYPFNQIDQLSWNYLIHYNSID